MFGQSNCLDVWTNDISIHYLRDPTEPRKYPFKCRRPEKCINILYKNYKRPQYLQYKNKLKTKRQLIVEVVKFIFDIFIGVASLE